MSMGSQRLTDFCRYGLFLPKQQKEQQAAVLLRKPIFDQDELEEDDEETGIDLQVGLFLSVPFLPEHYKKNDIDA